MRGRVKRPPTIVRQEGNMPQILLELGHDFSNPNEFRDYIRIETILKGYDLSWKKNEGNKIRLACANEKCEWRCFVSWDVEMTKWVIKSLRNVTCQIVRENR